MQFTSSTLDDFEAISVSSITTYRSVTYRLNTKSGPKM